MRAADEPPAHRARTARFGQRHFIVQDPNGVLIDVIQPIPPNEDFLRQYAPGAAAT